MFTSLFPGLEGHFSDHSMNKEVKRSQKGLVSKSLLRAHSNDLGTGC